MSTSEAALKWKINERRVRFLVTSNRIPGAYYEKHKWLIPITAEKPTDRRERKETINVSSLLKDEDYGDGNFGNYGGCYLPVSFRKELEPILNKYIALFNSSNFVYKLQQIRKEIQFRPTPLYFAERFSKSLGNVQVYIKREDLNFTNSLYVNQTIPLALLAKELEKSKIVSEAGDANYAVALAYSANYVGLKLEIFVGYNDYVKQKSTFDSVKLMGAELTLVTEGNENLYDATNQCFRKFLMNKDDYFYCFHDAVGPHPYPTINMDLQSVLSKEIKEEFSKMLDKTPKFIIGPMSIASNSLGIFEQFYDTSAKMIVVEAKGKINEKECSISMDGEYGKIHGCFTKSLVNSENGKCNYETLCSSFGYPVMNPKLLNLIEENRVKVVNVSDDEAIKALIEFSKIEGIIPCLEDAYTIAYIKKLAEKVKSGTILMSFTGSGNKDINFISSNYKKYI